MLGSRMWIGVDVGTAGIKFAKVRGKTIEKWGFEPLPLGSVAAGLIKDRGSVLGALKKLADKHDFKRGKVVTCIGGRDVIIRLITLPVVEKREFKRFLVWEIERNLPYSIDEAVYDYHVINSFRDEEEEKMEILVVALRRSLSEEVYDLFKEAGIELEAIEASPIPLLRLGEISEEESFMLVDIGAGTTDICVVHSDYLTLFRSLPTGGNAISSAISASLGLSYDQAEEVKKAKTVVELRPYIEDILNNIINEIGRCFDYVIGQYKENVVRHVFLTGGVSYLKGLDVFLEEVLNMPVKKIDPVKGLAVNRSIDEEIKSRYGIAIGLALRGS
ncbi:MAG: type IV pilus assembly protein PilM [Synergistetes bacterium]|nr:type IV pilus assembly protein PilM [Synergistota bacterium]MDK2871883.1 type pilus assembly protein PilM [bacterium]